ncbi:VRR-NUC domain-containing protein [Staphylococcus americanisciuri]|uniref:VRR-NUC domain-containing protein n=1 Tax=Staphylococcus americanisciuri TaxID=2973940 RepID=A0ABT2F2I0_9STAP|nr:VRR-NUC domain-containing protein [Staphylococcus americanisciuri]MCS4486358.1 VRR-NUC domain-containing protein [Staphylococcus americanisciuri]
MREVKVENYLAKEVKKQNGLCLKWVSPGTRGVPDRIVIMPKGQIYFVELKQVEGKISPLQKYFHKQLEIRDHNVYVLWSKKQVDEFMEEVLKD